MILSRQVLASSTIYKQGKWHDSWGKYDSSKLVKMLISYNINIDLIVAIERGTTDLVNLYLKCVK